MYIVDFMSVSLFPDPDPHLELLALSVSHNNFKINLCLFYRPPNSGGHIFDILVSYFDLICVGSFSNFIFIGDFNVNFADPSHPHYNSLHAIMSLYSLSQHVTDTTHTHHSGSSSTIDLLFTNEDSLLHTCETILPLSNSDHCGIRAVVNRKVHKQRCKSKGRKIWRYTYADWNAACDAIDEFDWDTIMSKSIDSTWENWLQQFMSIMNQFIPNCTLRSRHNLPWLTKSLFTLIKKRKTLFKRVKISGNFSKYMLARNNFGRHRAS